MPPTPDDHFGPDDAPTDPGSRWPTEPETRWPADPEARWPTDPEARWPAEVAVLPNWSPRPDLTQPLTTPYMAAPAPAAPVAPPPTRPLAAAPAARRRRSRFGRTLTSRAVLATCLAALISVLVTAAVAFPLAVRTSDAAARSALADKAQIAAELVDQRGAGIAPTGIARVVARLRSQGVVAYVVRNGRSNPAGLPKRFSVAVSNGQDVHGTAVIDGRRVIVEGRAVAGGAGIVLVTDAERILTGQTGVRLLLALLAGLIAGGLAGTLLARRLARPVRHAADAAARLSAGDRSVRVTPEPFVEAENLADALNGLATALTTSEGRQRDFLLSISHELRTPLTSLKGYAEALADGVVDAEGAQRAGQTMLTEAGNLERLVNDLLSLARLEAADFPVESVPVELVNLVNGVVEAWSGRWAAHGLVLRTELPTVPVIVHTDPGRIRQIVDGLLENALRVVPSGAPIVLSVRGPSAARPDYGIIEVRDGGPGFTDADLAVVFERGALYERYRGIRKVGSGLGLALAAGLVRRLGGYIDAGHAAEGGARFTVGLPTLRLYEARTSR